MKYTTAVIEDCIGQDDCDDVRQLRAEAGFLQGSGDHMTDSGDRARARKNDSASEEGATERKIAEESQDKAAGNPPRTTSFGWLTVPKFGSSASGGGELEPGPERD